MQQPTEQQETKLLKYSHKCQNLLCGIEYGTNSKASKTCSERCRQALSRSKRQTQDKKRLYRFETSPFAHSLARQCIRAETVQVVPQSLELLGELHQIFKLASRADGYGATRDYALCHLHPVDERHAVGTLHPSNLVVADRAINSKHGNTLPGSGIGHSILRCNLEPRWQVHPDSAPTAVIKKLVQYLGEAFCQELTVKLKLQPATKAKYLSQLAPHLDHETVKAAGNLDDLTTPQLGKLVQLVGGKSGSFSPDSYGMNPGEVFMAESKRLSKYYPALLEAYDAYSNVHKDWIGIYLHANLDPRLVVFSRTSSTDQDIACAKEKLTRLSNAMFALFHGAISLETYCHVLDTKLSHSFEEENLLVDSPSLCLVANPVCSAYKFTSAAMEELERSFDASHHDDDEHLDIPIFKIKQAAEKVKQSALERFLAA